MSRESVLYFLDVKECETGAASCDVTSTTCGNTVGHYVCDCKKGFVPNLANPNRCQGKYNIIQAGALGYLIPVCINTLNIILFPIKYKINNRNHHQS